MKRLLAIPLLLAVTLSLCSATPASTATTTQPETSTQAPAQATPAALPAEYLVLRNPHDDGTAGDYALVTNAADVRQMKGLLPNYEGGKEVTQKLTGTPLKIRSVKGTVMLPYEIYPNDLIVWYYDMKCATVKGAYAAASALLKTAQLNGVSAAEAPTMVEAREYGSGDHFKNYIFVTGAAAQPFLDCIKQAQAVEKPTAPLQDGSLILSVDVIRGDTAHAYYFYDYGYIEDPTTGMVYRMADGSLEPVRELMGLMAQYPASVTLRWQPGELPWRRTCVPAAAQNAGSTQKSMEAVLALLEKRTAATAPETAPATTPLLATVWKSGKITARYFAYEDGTLREAISNKWYTLSDGVFDALLAACKAK